jgi:hypothetical protein
MLHVTESQLSILVTSLILVRFEIVNKNKLRESKKTLDIMQTLINVSQGLIKK